MSILIANLIAQVGADLTQFKLGMNEVDARLAQVAVRGKQATQSVAAMRSAAASADALAARSAQAQARVSAMRPVALSAAYEAQAKALAAAEQQAQHRDRLLSLQSSGAGKGVIVQARRDLLAAAQATATLTAESEKAAAALQVLDEREARYARTVMAARRQSAVLMGRAARYEESAAAGGNVAQAIALRRRQDAREHQVRAFNNVAGTALTGGLVLGAGLAFGAKAGADFNQMLLTTAHNTQLSAAGVAIMNDTVKKLGLESGASMDDLAHGFRLLTDYGNSATVSQQMLRTAMMASVATGSDLSVTTELLAKATKEFNLPISQSAKTMSVMVETGRRTTLSMDQMVQVGGQLYATAANLGVSFIDANAALVTFTQHGLNATQAATQLRNDIQKIISPSAAVRKELVMLDKMTGQRLGDDFSSIGIRARHIQGVFQDIVKTFDLLDTKQRAALKVATPADLAVKLFPNLRGTVGASILSGTGFTDFQKNTDALTAGLSKGSQVQTMYAQSLQNLNQQLGRVSNAGVILASTVSTTLTPDIVKLLTEIDKGAHAFDSMSASTKSDAVRVAEWASMVLIGIGAAGKLVVGLSQLKSALIELGVAEDVFSVAGLAAKLAPAGVLGLAVAGMILLVKQLADDWKTTNKNAQDYANYQQSIYDHNLGPTQKIYNPASDGPPVDPRFDAHNAALAEIETEQKRVAELVKGGAAMGEFHLHGEQGITSINEWAYALKTANIALKEQRALLASLTDVKAVAKHKIKSNEPWTGPTKVKAPYGGDEDPGATKKQADAAASALDAVKQELDGLRQKYYDVAHSGDVADVIWDMQNGKLADLATYSRRAADALYAQMLAQAKLNDETKLYTDVQSDIDAAGLAHRLDAVKKNPHPAFDALMIQLTDPRGKYHDLFKAAQAPTPTQGGQVTGSLAPMTVTKSMLRPMPSGWQLPSAQHLPIEATGKPPAMDDVNKLLAAMPAKFKAQVRALIAQANTQDADTAAEAKKAFNQKNAEAANERRKKTEDDQQKRRDELNKPHEEAVKERGTMLTGPGGLRDLLQKSKDELFKAQGVKGSPDSKTAFEDEFVRSFKDKNVALFADVKTTNAQKDAYLALAKATADQIYANQMAAASAQLVSDANDKVSKGLKDIRDTLKHSVGDIQITDKMWSEMTKKQRADVELLKKQLSVKDFITSAMQGTAQILEQSLENVRQHGFKGAFSEIVSDFNTMLYQLAAKWLASQFLQLLQNQIPALMAAAFGSAGSGGGSTGGGNAVGGPMQQGMTYLVGENEPEYATVGADGQVRVAPANRSRAGNPRGGPGNSGGGTTIVVNNNVRATDVASFGGYRTQSQLAAKVAIAQRLSSVRNK